MKDGQIAVKAGTKLDRETKSTYRMTVTATDPDGLSASIDVTIMVESVDEAPEVTGGDSRKDYPENGDGSGDDVHCDRSGGRDDLLVAAE